MGGFRGMMFVLTDKVIVRCSYFAKLGDGDGNMDNGMLEGRWVFERLLLCSFYS